MFFQSWEVICEVGMWHTIKFEHGKKFYHNGSTT